MSQPTATAASVAQSVAARQTTMPATPSSSSAQAPPVNLPAAPSTAPRTTAPPAIPSLTMPPLPPSSLPQTTPRLPQVRPVTPFLQPLPPVTPSWPPSALTEPIDPFPSSAAPGTTASRITASLPRRPRSSGTTLPAPAPPPAVTATARARQPWDTFGTSALRHALPPPFAAPGEGFEPVPMPSIHQIIEQPHPGTLTPFAAPGEGFEPVPMPSIHQIIEQPHPGTLTPSDRASSWPSLGSQPRFEAPQQMIGSPGAAPPHLAVQRPPPTRPDSLTIAPSATAQFASVSRTMAGPPPLAQPRTDRQRPLTSGFASSSFFGPPVPLPCESPSYPLIVETADKERSSIRSRSVLVAV